MAPLRIKLNQMTSSQSYEGVASIGAYHIGFKVTRREFISSAGFTFARLIEDRVLQHRARLRTARRKRPGGRTR